MYLQQVLASLRRRWMLTGLALVVAVAAGYATAGVVGPTYTSESSVVLVPPPTTTRIVNADGTETAGNPYMYLGGLTEARDVLVKAMSSEAAHQQVSDSAGTGTYLVTPDFDTRAPMLVITTSAPTRAAASEVTTAVLDQVPTVLANIQADLNIPSNARITTRVVTDDPVMPNHKAQMRLVALATLGMLAVLAMLIGVIDGLLIRRQRRATTTRPDAAPTAGAGPEPGRDDAPLVVEDEVTPTEEPSVVEDEATPTEEPSVEQAADEPGDEPGDEPAEESAEQHAPAASTTPRSLAAAGINRSRRQRRRAAKAPLPAVPVKGAGVAARNAAARVAS
jgi:capsular polysaccharide biosynthesis protein